MPVAECCTCISRAGECLVDGVQCILGFRIVSIIFDSSVLRGTTAWGCLLDWNSVNAGVVCRTSGSRMLELGAG